jgi:hypothetical protein
LFKESHLRLGKWETLSWTVFHGRIRVLQTGDSLARQVDAEHNSPGVGVVVGSIAWDLSCLFAKKNRMSCRRRYAGKILRGTKHMSRIDP